MWPWEHVVVGYLAYSLFVRAYYRESPGALETLVTVGASLFPDVIDKVLAWEFGVFESGYAVGHSVFFAIPVCLGVGLFARHARRTRVGLAFAVAYLLHLPGDVIPRYVDGRLPVERVLWPVQRAPPAPTNTSFREQFTTMVGQYLADLSAGTLSTVEWARIGLVLFVFCWWLLDGAPVARELAVASVARLEQLVGFLRAFAKSP